MLYLLTGGIQAGKTRWIECRLAQLGRMGVPVYGVVAPGVWRMAAGEGARAGGGDARDAACARRVEGCGADAAAGPAPDRAPAAEAAAGAHLVAYEKLGIDNVLLPGGERVRLARRRDLALAEGGVECDGQSERAGLGWAMSDAAIARVNAHFDGLERLVARDAEEGGAAAPPRGLLVVDELGPLELVRGEGLASAVRLLLRGPQRRWPDALVVVRRSMLPAAHGLLDPVWGAAREISLG